MTEKIRTKPAASLAKEMANFLGVAETEWQSTMTSVAQIESLEDSRKIALFNFDLLTKLRQLVPESNESARSLISIVIGLIQSPGSTILPVENDPKSDKVIAFGLSTQILTPDPNNPSQYQLNPVIGNVYFAGQNYSSKS